LGRWKKIQEEQQEEERRFQKEQIQ
jgi:hypothetical protein